MCAECGCGKVERFGVQPLQAPPASPVDLVGDTDHEHVEHAHEHVHADGTRHSHPHAHGLGHEYDHDHPHGDAGHAHTHTHADGTTHNHPHAHGAGHHHTHAPAQRPQTIDLHQPILARNDRLAERNRGFLQAKGLLALNVLASPGAGKTTLIEKTVAALERDLPAAVIVGDLATARDAERIRAAGAPVVQITTGTVCHLDAEMVARGLEQLDLASRELLIIENVGNLVCPADFDLGESARVVLLSVTEGEDKPLKYPPMFRAAHVVIVTKTDLAAAAGCDREALRRNLRAVAPQARVFELSARTGEGLEAWLDWLRGLRRH
jgi:hydrogenase nickel incorporation protein HypB